MRGRYIQSTLNPQGHLATLLQKCRIDDKSIADVVMAGSRAEENVHTDDLAVSKDGIRRLHLHLSRASINVLRRLFRKAERWVSELDLEDVSGRCGRSETLNRADRDFISEWIPLRPGHTVCIDCSLLHGIVGPRASTYQMTVCALSKFTASTRLPNLIPTTVIKRLTS